MHLSREMRSFSAGPTWMPSVFCRPPIRFVLSWPITDPNKRDKLIDSLIGTEAFTDQWAYHYGELLRTRMAPFHVWTKQWLKVDRPYNEVFYDIVTSSTKSMVGQPAATSFYDPIGYIANSLRHVVRRR